MQWDVIVVGGGHAGIESALASVRIGCTVLLITNNMKRIGEMSCNPAIGGIAKGTLVREIDILGGSMAEIADGTKLQFKILNRKKGRAVWGPRVQSDSREYTFKQKKELEKYGIEIIEDEVTGLQGKDKLIEGVRTRKNNSINGKAIILAVGTFLGGKLFTGEKCWKGGRRNDITAEEMDRDLRERLFHVERFKTGTSPRVYRSSINFDRMGIQEGDKEKFYFSYRENNDYNRKEPCYLTKTNLKTKRIAKEYLDKSPLFTGRIKGKGPRYCPSFEDKVFRFPDKDDHMIFVEPMCYRSEIMYINGLSTSLPEEAQEKMLRSIIGLENAKIKYPGYAVEYSYFSNEEFDSTLKLRKTENIFIAGQICGTSGYEEAAALGILAGINAAKFVKNEEPVKAERENSYLGVMTDDLTGKTGTEPYRLFSSRSENRLHLRPDNADRRLFETGLKWGVIREEDLQRTKRYLEEINHVKQTLGKRIQKTTGINHCKKPGMEVEEILEMFPELSEVTKRSVEAVLLDERYRGYIERLKRRSNIRNRLGSLRIDDIDDFMGIKEISWEARESLSRIKPSTINEAVKMGGVRPSDIDGLILYLAKIRST